MLQVSSDIANYITGDARHFTAIMSFRNGTILSEEIGTLDFTQQTSSDDVVPGDVISRSLSGTLVGLTDTIIGQTFILSFICVDYNSHSTYGYLSNYTYQTLHNYHYGALPGTVPDTPIPMGEYKVTACSKQGELWTFEAHDMLYASDIPYTSGLTYPATLEAVEHEICNALGITFRDSVEQITIPYALEDVTYREMLSYIAGLLGKVCITGRTGKLEYRTFEVTMYIIAPERAADPDVSQAGVKVTSLHCGGFSATATGAQDRDLTFENPYMTAELFENVKDNFLGLQYTPLTVKHIMGDLRFDILDMVIVMRNEDGAIFDVPLTSINHQWDGGVWSSLASTASTKTAYTANRTNVRPIQQQIKAASQETIDYISGAKGGYVITKYNEDGQPIAHYYTDNLDPEQATNIMQINQNGLAGTNGGMNGTWKLAITNDGRINADQILTGILKAITVQSTNYSKDAQTNEETGSKIELDDGTFSFGNGQLKFVEDEDNPGTYKLVMKNAELVGGTFKVFTNDPQGALIEFSTGFYKTTLSPSGIAIEDEQDIHKKVFLDYGGITMFNGDLDPFGFDMPSVYMARSGAIQVLNGNISVINGDILIGNTSLKNYIQNHP